MSEEIEAVGAAVTGTAMARAVEDDTGKSGDGSSGDCLNCGSPVTGSYCSNCGQPLQVHRSIGAFWHDILHGVLHFEGKFWRTLPLLAWKPGELTRRYIHGQRARFISPMALFLFSVFLMFAVFSFIGSPFSGISGAADAAGAETASEAIAVEEERLETKIAEIESALATGELDSASESELQQDLLNRQRARNVMAVVRGENMPYPDAGVNDCEDGLCIEDLNVDLGPDWQKHPVSSAVMSTLRKVSANPDLLLYKLQANGYKFAWLLIPISLPFVWLTTIGRRGYHFYDHAVFTTYSISFMSLLFITCALLAALGVSDAIWAGLLIFYPPFHMYRQLRHAYQMSRIEALIRLVALLFFTVTSLILFFAILLALGLLG